MTFVNSVVSVLCIIELHINFLVFGSKTQPFHLVFSSDKDLWPSSNVRLFLPNLIPSIKYMKKKLTFESIKTFMSNLG